MSAHHGADLLLYSLGEFRELILGCLKAVRPRRVLEVGGEAGRFTRLLAGWAEELGFEVIVVEPAPSEALKHLCQSAGAVRLIEQKSPEALRAAGPCDVYFLDGDHNFHTVAEELAAIDQLAAGRPYLTFLHDVGWPAGHRDLYYDPEGLPPSAVHPHSFSGGVTLARAHAVLSGFRGEGAFAVAEEEGGARNGVLPAVETFLASREGLTFMHVPCVFGLGVIFPASAPWHDAVHRELAPYDQNPLLARLEGNRLALYLRVLELQDALAATTRQLDRLKLAREAAAGAPASQPGERPAPAAARPGAAPAPGTRYVRGRQGSLRRALGYDLYRARLRVQRIRRNLRRLLINPH